MQRMIPHREEILYSWTRGKSLEKKNCTETRTRSQNRLVPCQQQSSFPESLEGHWRPSLCIEIQYAEEVGSSVVLFLCTSPRRGCVAIKKKNEWKPKLFTPEGVLKAANCFSSLTHEPDAGLCARQGRTGVLFHDCSTYPPKQLPAHR